MATNKGFFRSSWEFLKNHWGELLAVHHVVSGFTSGKMSDDAPASAKSAFRAMGGTFGGKGDPEDEATYKKLLLNMDQTLRLYLSGWVGHAFPVSHPEKWIRERAKDRFEEWRVIICKMASDDEELANRYLTDLAKSIRRAYFSEVRKRGKTPQTIEDQEKQDCLKAAYLVITQKMAVEGTPIPGENFTPFAVQIRKLFIELGFQAQEKLPIWWQVGRALAKKTSSDALDSYDRWEISESKKYHERVEKRNPVVKFFMKFL